VTRASRFLTGLLTHADALGGPVTDPGWRTKPSWYIVTIEDRMIPGSPAHHVPADWVEGSRGSGPSLRFVSQPAAVADLIKQAVSAIAAQQ
jgi:hypothetical protein